MQFFEMLLRNDQGMSITDRTDIEKSEDGVILENLRTGYLPRDHFAENTIIRTHTRAHTKYTLFFPFVFLFDNF